MRHAAHVNYRSPFVRLPLQKRCRRRDLIRQPDRRHLQVIAEQIGAPAQILDRGQPRDPNRHADGAVPPGAPVRIVYHDADIVRGCLTQSSA